MDGDGPEELRARVADSERLRRSRRLDEAERVAARVVAEAPRWLPGRREHALVASARKDWNTACERWAELADLVAEEGGSLEAPDRARLVQARRRSVTTAIDHGRLDEADRLAAALVADDETDLDAWYLYARVAGMRRDVHGSAQRLGSMVETARRTGRMLEGAAGVQLREMLDLRAVMSVLDLPSPLEDGPLVVIENGAHPLVVLELLARLRPSQVLGERRIEGLRYPGGEVAPLRGVTEGSPAEQRLAAVARDRAERIVDALVAATPHEARHLVEAQRFDLVSRQLSHLVVERTCAEATTSTAASGFLLVRGNGRNAAIIGGAATARFGRDRVFEIDGRLGGEPRRREVVPFRPAAAAVPDLGRPRRRLTPVRRRSADAPPPRPHGDRPTTDPCPTVLVWSVHDATIVPVVRELAADGPVRVIVVADHERALAPYHELGTTLPVTTELLAGLPHEGPAGAGGRPSPVDGRAARNRKVRAGLGADEPMRTASDLDVAWILGRAPRLQHFGEHLRHLLVRQPADVLITARDRSGQERTALRVARELGVPTLAVQPVLMNDNPLYNPLYADHTTVFDEHARQLFIASFGARPDQVTVTGFARFDELARHRAAPDTTGPRMVLLAMQMFSLADAERLVRSVSAGLGADDQLLIKLHPREPASRAARYAALLEAAGAEHRSEVVARGALDPLVTRASLVVSGWSNSLVEAAISGRPALAVNLTGEPLPVPFAELGIAYEARSEDEVRRVVPELLGETALRSGALQRQQAYLDLNPHLVDDVPAARRIADVARDLAGGRLGARAASSPRATRQRRSAGRRRSGRRS